MHDLCAGMVSKIFNVCHYTLASIYGGCFLKRIIFILTGASEHMIRVSKKLVAEKGILSTPNVKCGHRLPSSTETLIKDFYMNDEYSRQMPGKKDFVSIRTPSGRVQEQKRLILNNLKELHALFKEENCGVKVSFSKFAMLRPKNCVLAGASGTHSVCVCQLHQNPKLMLEAFNVNSLQNRDNEVVFSDYKSMHKLMICEAPTEQCYLRICSKCPGSDGLRGILTELFDDNNIDTITYKQWTSTDRSTLETIIKSTEEFVDTLVDSLVNLLTHSFIAKQQSQYVNHLKKTIKTGIFLTLLDFSQNYSFIVQDAVQGFHWNNSQATIHPFVFYFMDENDELKNGNFVVISDCLKHDATAVNLFIKHYLQFLKEKYGQLSKIIYFSDGCGGQYKNKNNFVNVTYHRTDFAVDAEWHFYATSHGKSASDGIGGTLKRLAAKASLQRPMNDHILTPKQLYEWAKSNLSSLNVHYISQVDYNEHAKLMEPRFLAAKTLKGTRKQHTLIPVEPGVLRSKFYSFSEKHDQHKMV